MKLRVLVTAVAALSAGLAAAPAWASDIAFSADAVQKTSGHDPKSAKIYRMGSAMRMETRNQGRTVVQIILSDKGVMWVLDPDAKTYMEFTGPAAGQAGGTQAANPCTRVPQGATCKPVGKYKIGEAITTRYDITAAQQGGKPMVVYWDETRKMPLRQDFPDGGMLHNVMVGKETLAGRTVEHWRMTMTGKDGKKQTGETWYDPELKAVVRETHPSGMARELANIKVGPIDSNLFRIPQGYRKVDPPRPQKAGQGQGQRPRTNPYGR